MLETVYDCNNNYSFKLINESKCLKNNINYGEMNSDYIQEVIKDKDEVKMKEYLDSLSSSLANCVFDGYDDFLMFIVDQSIFNKECFNILLLGIYYIGFIYEEEDYYWKESNLFDGLYIANSFILKELFTYYTPFSFFLVIESNEGCPIVMANELLLIFSRELNCSTIISNNRFFRITALSRSDNSNYKIIKEDNYNYKIIERFNSTLELPTFNDINNVKNLIVDIVYKELLIILSLKKKVTGFFIIETLAKYERLAPYLDWLHLIGLFIYSEEPLDKLDDNINLALWKPDVFFNFLQLFDTFISEEYYYSNNKFELYLPYLLIRTPSNNIIGDKKFYCNNDEVFFCEFIALQK